jgi:hypothetical protein
MESHICLAMSITKKSNKASRAKQSTRALFSIFLAYSDELQGNSPPSQAT